MSIANNLFCVLKENLQKPKKKKEEANGTTEAKLNGIETKPKKAKTKKNEDVAKEDSSAIQSEEIKTTFTISSLLQSNESSYIYFSLSTLQMGRK